MPPAVHSLPRSLGLEKVAAIVVGFFFFFYLAEILTVCVQCCHSFSCYLNCLTPVLCVSVSCCTKNLEGGQTSLQQRPAARATWTALFFLPRSLKRSRLVSSHCNSCSPGACVLQKPWLPQAVVSTGCVTLRAISPVLFGLPLRGTPASNAGFPKT